MSMYFHTAIMHRMEREIMQQLTYFLYAKKSSEKSYKYFPFSYTTH
jgi:hypothetical protein